MKKILFIWLPIALAITVLTLLFSTLFADPNAGMIICLSLFFGVYPVFSIISGVIAGNAFRYRWWMPLAFSVLFLGGVWGFIQPFQVFFLVHAGIYLLIGMLCALIQLISRKKAEATQDAEESKTEENAQERAQSTADEAARDKAQE